MNINDILSNMINATPHAITIRINDKDHTFAPSGIAIRLNTDTKIIAPNVVSVVTSVPTDLSFDPTKFYFVSGMVAAANLPTGLKVVYPPTDAAYLIKNDLGHTVAITAVQIKM